MANRNRLTNNSDETDVSQFISGDVVFSIPFFQRSYRWKPQRLNQLNLDILTIVDEASEIHFLGAVIIHGRSSNPSDPKIYEVIDGQQRITTLFLYVAAVIKIIAEYGEASEAAGLFLKYMVIPRETNLHSNLKLYPCKDDRAQFNKVIDDLLLAKGLKAKVESLKLKRLQSTGKDDGVLWKNYKLALKFFKHQYETEGIQRIQEVYQAMLQSMSLVQIDVWDPTNGPKIFDSLNSRQEPMTIGDLVRNEIFSKVADEQPEYIEQIDQQYWQPFYTKFQKSGHNLFDSYFFPYGLIQDSNLKKSEVYSALRDQWRDISDPKEIIGKLALYQDAFLDIELGSNIQNHSEKVAQLFINLYRSGLPSSTLPFLMALSFGVKNGTIAEKDAIEVLTVIESFLVRRTVCGHEPTGLHAVFKRLWIDCKKQPTMTNVMVEIKKHKTVVWPNEATFREAIISRPLYGVGVTKYLLREYDRSLGGDQPKDIPWIEHVLPETPVKDWYDIFTKEQHRDLKDQLANLIPLSEKMNEQVSNRPYSEKQKYYKEDSMFKTARQFAETYQVWNPSNLNARALLLADWAVERWPY